jgi:SAM-dependent methyltransferase
LLPRRRESFDDAAELYASARPSYPEALVRDLISSNPVTKRPGSIGNLPRTLEIGPGTGQLTLPLVQAGFPLTAVELGPHLARALGQRVEPFPNATVIIADFDEWAAEPASFDLIVCATAFHWLDPSTRVSKCASLAIIETHWGAGTPPGSLDRFAVESQSCYARWFPDHDPAYRPPGLLDLRKRNEELKESGFFAETVQKRYVVDRSSSSSQYCALLGTFSDVLALSEQRRAGFLGCIEHLIRSRFAGHVTRRDVHDLWLAKLLPGAVARDASAAPGSR